MFCLHFPWFFLSIKTSVYIYFFPLSLSLPITKQTVIYFSCCCFLSIDLLFLKLFCTFFYQLIYFFDYWVNIVVFLYFFIFHWVRLVSLIKINQSSVNWKHFADKIKKFYHNWTKKLYCLFGQKWFVYVCTWLKTFVKYFFFYFCDLNIVHRTGKFKVRLVILVNSGTVLR